MDDALRKHKLVTHEATTFTDDPVHCFFHAFLDEWACTDFPIKHLDIFALRQDVKNGSATIISFFTSRGSSKIGYRSTLTLPAESRRQAYTDSLSKKSKNKNGKLSAMVTYSMVSCHRAYAHVWEIITRALQWQTSTLLS